MAEEMIFKTGVDTGDSVKSVNKLEKSIKDVSTASTQIKKTSEDALKDLNARVNSGTMSYQQMTKAVKDYQTIALTAGRTSAVGKQALQDASQLKDKLIDLDNEVKRLADDQKNLKGAMELSSTVVAGYGAVKGAMALTGVESESLQKSMVKLQAAQTLLSSLDRIRTALQKESSMMMLIQNVRTKLLTASQYGQATATGVATTASKALRVAMLSIPIVAIIAGIVALVSAIAYFASAADDAEEVNEKLTKSFEKQDEILGRRSAKIMKDTDNRIAIAKSEGKEKGVIHEMELERLRKEEALRNISTKIQLSQIDKKKLAYQRALSQGNTDLAKEIKDEIKQIRDKYKSLKALDGQYEVDKQVMENNFNKESSDATKATNKENADKAKAWRDKRKAEEEAEAKLKLERERLYQDLMVQNIEDQMLRESTMLNLKFAREREALIEKYGQDTELLKQLDEKQATERAEFNQQLQEGLNAKKAEADAKALEDEKLLAEQQRKDEVARLEGKLIAMREDFEATQELKAELALIEMETALEQENLTEGEKFKIKEEYKAKILALETETAERTKQINKEAIDAGIGFAEQGTNAIQGLSDLLFASKGKNLKKGSAEEEKHARKQFKVNKALQLSMAVIDGFKAITTSLSQSPLAIGPIPNPAGIASLAFAGITSAVNIAKIASSKFSGGSSGGGGASMPTVTAPNIPSQADISGGTDNESTLTDGLTDNNAPTNKVVLVDSDIKAGLANEAKVDVISTIG
jgi:hypothetical protein